MPFFSVLPVTSGATNWPLGALIRTWSPTWMNTLRYPIDASASSQKLECAGKSSRVCNCSQVTLIQLNMYGNSTYCLSEETKSFVFVLFATLSTLCSTKFDTTLKRSAYQTFRCVPGPILCGVHEKWVFKILVIMHTICDIILHSCAGIDLQFPRLQQTSEENFKNFRHERTSTGPRNFGWNC